MNCNCPIILSDCETHKEVAKTNTIYFSKENFDDLINVLEKIFMMTIILIKYPSWEKIILKIFHGKKCSAQTIRAYRELNSKF